MKISPQAQKEASTIGIKNLKIRAAAAFAETKERPYTSQKLAAYLQSIRRQFTGADVKLKDNVVFIFNAGNLVYLYILPETLREKNRR